MYKQLSMCKYDYLKSTVYEEKLKWYLFSQRENAPSLVLT